MNKVCIIGVGYVGEHLLTTFAKGYPVVGVDVSEKRIADLKPKYSGVKNIHLQSSYNNLEDCNIFLVSVPTLVKKDKSINVSFLHSVKNSIQNIIKPGSLLVVESSVYVGATREIFGEFRERGIFVGFSPERVDPGRVEPPMEDIPKIISGVDIDSLNVCEFIYSKVIKKVVPVSSCECAEMCKLYENCFRMVNIANVNEISDMCEKLGIDTHEMISAASTKPFGFMPFFPGVGVGGHCIPVNPYYLFQNGNLPVLKYSTELMEGRPKKKAYELMNRYKPQNVLIAGIGFKRGESLLTNSPGYALYQQLEKIGMNVEVYDNAVQSVYTNNDIKFLNTQDFNAEKLKQKYDLVVINLALEKKEKSCLEFYKNLGGRVHDFTM